jgi:hypothetical protein
VLLGNGDGTFQAPPISTNSGASLTALAAIDLNGDGKADVVGIFKNSLMVYLANGDGTFAAGVPYSLGAVQIAPPTLIVFGEFNGDHKTDVAVLSAASAEQEIVLLGNGDGTFQSTPLTSTGAATITSVVLGDFNGDGKLDLATLGGSNQSATVFLQLGNGNGTFKAPTTAITGAFSGVGSNGAEYTNLAAADVNGDGKLDVVLAADVIGTYLGNGDGSSNTPTYYQPMSPGNNAGIAIKNFNSDGKPDVAVGGEILLGNGNGKFEGPPTVSCQVIGLRRLWVSLSLIRLRASRQSRALLATPAYSPSGPMTELGFSAWLILTLCHNTGLCDCDCRFEWGWQPRLVGGRR